MFGYIHAPDRSASKSRAEQPKTGAGQNAQGIAAQLLDRLLPAIYFVVAIVLIAGACLGFVPWFFDNDDRA